MNYNLALGVLYRFLRVFVAGSVSAICVYWTANMGDLLPAWLLALVGTTITAGLAALDKWVRGKLGN